MPQSGTKYIRDQITWLAYILSGLFGYIHAAIGPIIPFLRAERNLDYTIGSLHISAYALGWVFTGLLADQIVARFGRRFVIWGSGSGMAIGILLLTQGNQTAWTIAGTLMMGFANTLALVVSLAILADWQRTHSAFALTEANIVITSFGILAPLCLGLLAHTVVGWRGAVYVGIGAFMLISVYCQRVSIPTSSIQKSNHRNNRGARLPIHFWAYGLALFFGISVEWCVLFWGADFLAAVVGLSSPRAAFVMSVFVLAMLTGRIIGNRLTQVMRSSTLLLMTLSITLMSLPIFWLASAPTLSIVGLCIAGLGISNIYPLSIAIATSMVPEQTDTAMARLTLIVGIASLSVPFTLGWLADRLGFHQAYGIVIPLAFFALVATIIANRLAAGSEHRHTHQMAEVP